MLMEITARAFANWYRDYYSHIHMGIHDLGELLVVFVNGDDSGEKAVDIVEKLLADCGAKLLEFSTDDAYAEDTERGTWVMIIDPTGMEIDRAELKLQLESDLTIVRLESSGYFTWEEYQDLAEARKRGERE